MPTFLALADVLLVSLEHDPIFELTVPSKLQPYMACGKPVLAVLEGEGARVVEESGGGLASAPGDVEGLVRNLGTLTASGPERLAAMGARSREYFLAHFERGLLMSRLEVWMRELVGLSGPEVQED
jgi:glycosyltransferase involved in cell wall biosynthesis